MGKILRKLIAQSKEEVGQKPIDFFSLGHIILGFVCFGFSFVFLKYSIFVVPDIISKLISISVVFYVGLIWEFIENFSKSGISMKFSKERDSLMNSLSDIAFTSLGGVLAFFLLIWYFPVFIFLIILMIVGRYINF